MIREGKYHHTNIERIETAYPKDAYSATEVAVSMLESHPVEEDFQVTVEDMDDHWLCRLEYVQ